MTPSRDVDEIASALIDGALGPDEAEAARRDPAVAARAAEMQAARQAVRRVPPPDPARRDDAIAAALAAADEPPPLADPGPSPVPPASPFPAGRGTAGPTAARDRAAAGTSHRAGRPLGAISSDSSDAAAAGDRAALGGDARAGRAVPGYDVSGDPAASGGLDAPAGGPAGGPATVTPPHPFTETDDRPVGPGGGAQGGRVVPMGPGRRRRWTDPRWLGAAAAVLLVLALGGVLATRSADSDSSDQAATASDSAPSTGGGDSAQESGGGTGSAESGGTSTAPPDQAAPGVAPDGSSGAPSRAALVDLGEVGSAGELADRARHALADTNADTNADRNADSDAGDGTGSDSEANADQSSGSGPLTASAACPDPLASPTEDAGPVVLEARATLAGRPVDVWVHDDGTSRRMVAVATDGSCAVVADRPVPG
jgi:hypothetical protein